MESIFNKCHDPRIFKISKVSGKRKTCSKVYIAANGII